MRILKLVLLLCAVLLLAKPRSVASPVGSQETTDAAAAQLVLVRAEDADGQPVPGATVMLTYRSQSIESFSEFKRSSSETDASGQAIVELPSNATRPAIRIAKSGRIAQLRRWRSANQMSDEISVVLCDGMAIGGFVRDEKGQPIKDVRVDLWIESGRTAFVDPPPGRNNLIVEGQFAPRTDADGSWRYDGVPEDAIVRARLTHPDYCSETEFVSNRLHLTQSDYRNESAEFVMRRGIELSGRVVDSNKRPIAKAVVLIERTKDPQSRRQSVETTRDGMFLFRALLEPGPYRIAATAPSWAPGLQTIELSEAATPPMEITLDKGLPLLIQVVDASNEPIRAVVVPYFEDSGLLGRRELEGQPDPMIPTQTDANGKYEWPNAPEDKLKVWVSAPNHKSKTIDAVAGGDEMTVQLEPLRKLKGHCIDATTGEPVKRFLVFPVLHGMYPDRVYPTVGFNGTFTLSDDVVSYDSEMKLMIEAPGYRTFMSEETIGGDKPMPEKLEFKLEPAEDVTGTIVDSNGKPVAGALISVRPSNLLTSVAGTPAPEHVRLVTDRRGEFRFPAQTQSFSLNVLAKQGSVVQRFSRNKSNLGEIQLQSNATVQGVVLQNGIPIEGATLNLYYGFGSDFGQTDAEGRFEFCDLPSGNVTLHTTLPTRDGAAETNPERLSKSIKLNPGDTANVTVEFER